jgi:hypothetical protein
VIGVLLSCACYRFDPAPFSSTDGVQLAVMERAGKPHALIKRLLAADPVGAGPGVLGTASGSEFVPLGASEADLVAKLKVVVCCVPRAGSSASSATLVGLQHRFTGSSGDGLSLGCVYPVSLFISCDYVRQGSDVLNMCTRTTYRRHLRVCA